MATLTATSTPAAAGFPGPSRPAPTSLEPSIKLPALPALVVGRVAHRRRSPVAHAFAHTALYWLVDLDGLPHLPWYLRPLAQLRSADHLGDPALPLKANVESYLAQRGIDLGEGGRVVMLSGARQLGYVFNPISVFWCFDSAGALACVVAEVHNTYGGRHAYFLQPGADGRARADKALYVSPFFDVSGSYDMQFALRDDAVFVAVRLLLDDAVAFRASLHGRLRPATRRGVVWSVLRYPLSAWRVPVLIRLHGVWLWLRRVPVQQRRRTDNTDVTRGRSA